MDASNIINLSLLLVTAIGVFVAIYQAKEARAARNDAQASSASAAEHERAALAAAEKSASEAGRSASALEEANEIARQSLPRDPLTLITHDWHKHEIRNDSSDTLWGVSLIQADGGDDVSPYVEMPVLQLAPGESILFGYEKTFDSPASTTIVVSWGYPDTTERKTWRRTIS